MRNINRPTGMYGFAIVWLGQAERPFFIIWLAHSSGTWGWHGTPDMLQLPRRDPGWVGGIFYSSNSACRGYPARSRYDDHCRDGLIPSVLSHF